MYYLFVKKITVITLTLSLIASIIPLNAEAVTPSNPNSEEIVTNEFSDTIKAAPPIIQGRAVNDKYPQMPKPTVNEYSYDNGTGTGYLDVSWAPVEGVTKYQIILFNGSIHSYWDVSADQTTWTTKGKGMFPTAEQIDAGQVNYRRDGKGTEFDGDPSTLYKKAFEVNAGSLNYANEPVYYVRVTAVHEDGASPISDATIATIPEETTEIPDVEVPITEDGLVDPDFLEGCVSDTQSGCEISSLKDEIIEKQAKLDNIITNLGLEVEGNANLQEELQDEILRLEEQSKQEELEALEASKVNPVKLATYKRNNSLLKAPIPTVETYLNDEFEDTGHMEISWNPVSNAIGYKLAIFNGIAYEYVDVGEKTSFSTKNTYMNPTDEELSEGKFSFHWDGSGKEFPRDVYPMYEKAKELGYYDYTASKYYFVRLIAVYPEGDSPLSDAAKPIIPDEVTEIEEESYNKLSNVVILAMGFDEEGRTYTLDELDKMATTPKSRKSIPGASVSFVQLEVAETYDKSQKRYELLYGTKILLNASTPYAKPSHFTVTRSFYRSDSINGLSDRHKKETDYKVKAGFNGHIIVDSNHITTSKFRKMEVKVTPVRTGSKYTSFTEVLGKKLHNKKGIVYPSYTDKISGKKLAMPTRSNISPISKELNAKRRAEFGKSNGPRAKFVAWYDKTYNVKIDYSPKNKNGYDVHHVIPLQYNGANLNANFLVIKKEAHKTVSKWWTSYR